MGGNCACFGGICSPKENQFKPFVPQQDGTQVSSEHLRPWDAKGQKDAAPANWKFGKDLPDTNAAFLGEGAYGWVWRARDSVTEQVYAVKVLEAVSQTAFKVDKRELQVTGKLIEWKHPCLVEMLNVILHADATDACSLVMEFCQGGDLLGKIQAHRLGAGGYNCPPQWCMWVAQIFLGLRHLHMAIEVLHRDLKPDNVLLSADSRRAKLTDFGMSRLSTKSTGTFTLNKNLPPGTPHYIAPEVVMAKPYDHRADLYSFGVMTWILLTGGNKSIPLREVPQPPCAHFDQTRQLDPLTKNWNLIRLCVQDPAKHDANPLPDEAAKDFVLKLTDRKDYQSQLKIPKVTHEDVQNHPLLKHLLIPASDGTTLEQWLKEREQKLLP